MIPDAAIPVLPRGVRLHWCKVREGWFLLAPERALKMDTIAAAVLGEVDGARSLAQIVDRLAETYKAPRDRICADVATLLEGLRARRMLEIAP